MTTITLDTLDSKTLKDFQRAATLFDILLLEAQSEDKRKKRIAMSVEDACAKDPELAALTPYHQKKLWRSLVQWGCAKNDGPRVRHVKVHPFEKFPKVAAQSAKALVTTEPTPISEDDSFNERLASHVAREMWERHEALREENVRLRQSVEFLRAIVEQKNSEIAQLSEGGEVQTISDMAENIINS